MQAATSSPTTRVWILPPPLPLQAEQSLECSSRTPSADSPAVLCHERLSIVGVESGAQPLTNADETILLAVNGEIYNHRLIRKSLKEPYHFKTTSDCEVVIPLVSTTGRRGEERQRGGDR